MTKAGVREIKDHLSEYIRRVRDGERVVITDRGRPVAELVGVGSGHAEEAAWAMVRERLGDWGGGKPQGLAKRPRVPGRRAEEIVLEDRR